MPSTNADRLLSRITALHKSLHLDEGGHVSSMERDLMLNYLRELYEIYSSGEFTMATGRDRQPERIADAPAHQPTQADQSFSGRREPATRVTTQHAAPASVTAPPSVSVPPTPPEPAPDPVAKPQPAPPPTPKPAEVEMRPPSPPRQAAMPEVPNAPVPPPPAPAMASNTAIVQPNPAPAPAPKPTPTPTPAVATTTEVTDDPQLQELFADRGAPGRFGRQPLSDLTRALSINNRILFSRDLFGGDNDLLNTTLQQLNTLSDFEEAQPLLASFARRYDWTEDAHRETAQEFCELVRRRYV